MAGRVIRLKELIKHTGLSKSVIYDRMDPKSSRHDPTFPRSFSLGGAAVGWYLEEVDQWLHSCARPDHKPAPPRSTSVVTPERTTADTARPTTTEAIPAKKEDRPDSNSLTEVLVTGGQLNAKLLGFLRMKTWSPTMAALLVSGVEPPNGCEDIPDGGTGLDGKSLHASDGRLHDARRLLRAWNRWYEDEGEPPKPQEFTPFEFLEWCTDEKGINGDWLRYMLELVGMNDPKSPDFSAARLSALLERTKLFN